MKTTVIMPKLDAKVKPFTDGTNREVKLLAFAELTIADAFVIKGIRVLKREGEEPFVSFPAERRKAAGGDRWFDVAHPVNVEARAAATALVLDRFYGRARE